MVKRLVIFLAFLLLIPAAVQAELSWAQDTEGQKVLKAYTERANQLLSEAGETPVNRIFEIYPGFAVLGITQDPNAETPEGVEITVTLSRETMLRLELRVSDPDRFPAIAASLIRALYGEGMSAQDAVLIPEERAGRAKKNPNNSFEEPVETMNGTIPRVYYAYYPNQYHDGVSWLQMTLVFPVAGTWNGEGLIIGEEENRQPGLLPEEEANPEYEGFFSEDDYEHLEIFTTPTPEPDSAAMEYDFR